MNLERQKRRLYAFSFLSCLRITDAVWVVLLVGRGYRLWQIGLAEGIYHVTSLLCEVPSGMAADLLGRRRTLALAGVLGAVSALCMAGSRSFFGVGLAMLFSALAGSFLSGTQDALAYDSLVAAGRTEQYVSLCAACGQWQGLALALSDLASFLTGALGFAGFYGADAAISLSRSAAALRLAEPVVTQRQARRQRAPFADLPARFCAHTAASVRFLRDSRSVRRLVLADALLTLPSYLTLMYLQQRLRELGLAVAWLGVPLLAVDLCRIAGSAAGGRLHPKSLRALYAGCAAVQACGLFCAGLAPAAAATAGAMLAVLAVEVWSLHAQARLNDAYPSDQRATLVSVNNMVYSLLMIAASPLTGWIGDRAGSAGAPLCAMGAGMLALGLAAGGGLLRREMRRKSGN
jgi:MFS family permease